MHSENTSTNEENKDREFMLKFTAEGKNERNAFSIIQKAFCEVTAVEIVGRRYTGKSVFIRKLLKDNQHIKCVLIVTKGPIPYIPGCRIETATDIDTLICIIKGIIAGYAKEKVDMLVLDTLTTILSTEEGVKRKKEVYSILKEVLFIDIRIISVSSIIFPITKTSSFFKESIVFRRLL